MTAVPLMPRMTNTQIRHSIALLYPGPRCCRPDTHTGKCVPAPAGYRPKETAA